MGLIGRILVILVVAKNKSTFGLKLGFVYDRP